MRKVTIVVDVAPEAFLRAMPDGAADADPYPGPPPKPPAASPEVKTGFAARWRRKHKR
jgi:hypothetical protein